MSNTRQTFHEELAALEEQILQMGAITGTMLAQSVEALQRGDTAMAEIVIDQDDLVDAMDIDIETRCIRLLALQQPMARDLRQIGSALKVITDLERIGDHAVDIAKIGRKLSQQFFVQKPLVDTSPLAGMAHRMLNQSLEALIRRDTKLANQVCADDDNVDAEFKSLREQLLGLTQADGSLIAPASYMLLAVVYLERIADHATNIAERVCYVETGQMEQITRSHRRESASRVA